MKTDQVHMTLSPPGDNHIQYRSKHLVQIQTSTSGMREQQRGERQEMRKAKSQDGV